ncbi:MAG TPA: O-antigen ligase family protein [Terriglobia bacterium]|nr:O-antigen ligase family protein [Terriglobia bacterium]
MSGLLAHLEIVPTAEEAKGPAESFPAGFLHEPLDRLALTLAICAVPLSIAISESFLAVSLLARVLSRRKIRPHARLPRSFWFWLVLAALEICSWLISPHRQPGWSEMRHLALLACLGFLLPCLVAGGSRLTAWKAVFLSSGLGSIFLIGSFLVKAADFYAKIEAGGEARFYLRTGGFLGNWMVYSSVELTIFAALLSFWAFYPQERKRWWLVFALNLAAIALSLTRSLWFVCWLLAGIELARRRSKWLWLLAALPALLYLAAPGSIRARIRGSLDPNFYSNQERIEMLRVGWRMIQEHPLTGVGPGRAGELYLQYLKPHAPVPRYHGHLHNNLAQIAATFGLPVAVAAILLVLALYRDLFVAFRAARVQEDKFCCLTSLLALTGFLIAGLFDYNYGHSLGLILLSFAILSPLFSWSYSAAGRNSAERAQQAETAPALTLAWIAQRFALRKAAR